MAQVNLQKIINKVAKYPWRFGYGSWLKCPLTKECGISQVSLTKHTDAAKFLGVTSEHTIAFVGWWDGILDGDKFDFEQGRNKLVALGYTIPAGPRLIRARRKTKRVRAYQYLRGL